MSNCDHKLYSYDFINPFNSKTRLLDPRPHPLLKARHSKLERLFDENNLKRIRSVALNLIDKYELIDYVLSLDKVSKELGKSINKMNGARLMNNHSVGASGVIIPARSFDGEIDQAEIEHDCVSTLVEQARQTKLEDDIFRK